MRQLDRYIGSSVLWSVLVVSLIVLGLDMLFAYIGELEDLEGEYDAVEALIYVVLTMPRRLYDLLPVAVLVGCLVGLGTLASNSELTVMRAAGVSVARIIGAVMKPLVFVMVGGVLLGEYAAPYSEGVAESRRAIAVGSGEAIKSKGLWHREGNEFIHINAVQPDGMLRGITRYRFDDERRLLEASFANRATVQGNDWLLQDVQFTRFLDSGNSEVGTLESLRWNAGLSPELLRVVLLEPDVLSLRGLWRYQNYLAEQELNNTAYWLSFWRKLLQPVTTATLVFVAISFIFGPLRSVTLGQRIFTGVLVGFSFRIVQDLLGPSSLVFGFSPLIAVVAPILVLVVMGILLMRRAG
ncbi:MAG TPA: LPS export ABC transporter permease LptG [Pseudomonas xinjiangensis]|uniref:LPS export ABC transporter permease LptG n=2 Tax=root TaxID=1 RepID=A0A7V1BMK2_9GAMM|nr:LPS export ABC transporter permease LptG [Halopseudomonas xinjiangensis]HEC49191.1 LPS export ABC transporter permease LptG [Halopseudomonas xinjiangensis]